MNRNSCAFTGHRPSKFSWGYNENDPRCVELKAALSAQISELASSGITHFLSGMGEGVDLWSAISVLKLRKENPTLKLHCILPCTGQADKWSDSAREPATAGSRNATPSGVFDCLRKRMHEMAP